MNRQRLKKLRKDLGLTQKDVAQAINITPPSISGYETGKKTPTIDTVKDLCVVLKTTPNYLLEFDVPITMNEDEDNTYDVYISKEDLEIIKEIKKYNTLYRQISSNPKKWISKINDIFN